MASSELTMGAGKLFLFKLGQMDLDLASPISARVTSAMCKFSILEQKDPTGSPFSSLLVELEVYACQQEVAVDLSPFVGEANVNCIVVGCSLIFS